MTRKPSITPDKIVRDLEALRVAAMEAGAYAPALRAAELLGRHLGMWQTEIVRERTLEDLVNESFKAAGEIGKIP